MSKGHPYTDDQSALHARLEALEAENKHLRAKRSNGVAVKPSLVFRLQQLRKRIQRPRAVFVLAALGLMAGNAYHAMYFWPWVWNHGGGWRSGDVPTFNLVWLLTSFVFLAGCALLFNDYTEMREWKNGNQIDAARKCLVVPFALPLAPTAGAGLSLILIGILLWLGGRATYRWFQKSCPLSKMLSDAFPKEETE